MRRIFICLDDRNRPEDAPADYKDTFIEFINPEIEYLSDETVELYEGCLSFPGHNGAITRSKKVKVKAQDRNGNWFELEAEDLLARCIQHENDHLDGITIMESSEYFYEDTEEAKRLPVKRKETTDAHSVHGNPGYRRGVPEGPVCCRSRDLRRVHPAG